MFCFSLIQITKSKRDNLSAYYLPRTKYKGRLCFDTSLCVCPQGEGTPVPDGGGVPPSSSTGGQPILPNGGYPIFPDGGTSHQDWMGCSPIRTGCPRNQEWMPIGQVVPRAVRLLRFLAGGLSCVHSYVYHFVIVIYTTFLTTPSNSKCMLYCAYVRVCVCARADAMYAIIK